MWESEPQDQADVAHANQASKSSMRVKSNFSRSKRIVRSSRNTCTFTCARSSARMLIFAIQAVAAGFFNRRKRRQSRRFNCTTR